MAKIINYDELNNLSNLETLTIINNQHIDKLDISNLSNLKRLILVSNYNLKQIIGLDKLKKLSVLEIDNYIKSLGFHKTKASNFKYIVDEISKLGYVPDNREYLESLKGVGRKTASVVLGILFDIPSFAVDTHVYRVSKRLGITNSKDDILKTEIKLKKYFDEKDWNRINSQLVLFGRYHCKSKNPKCESCKLKDICKEKIPNK